MKSIENFSCVIVCQGGTRVSIKLTEMKLRAPGDRGFCYVMKKTVDRMWLASSMTHKVDHPYPDRLFVF